MLGLLVWIFPLFLIRCEILYVSYNKSLILCGTSPLSPCTGAKEFPFADLFSAFDRVDNASEGSSSFSIYLSDETTYVLDPKKVVANRSFVTLRNRTVQKNIIVKADPEKPLTKNIMWNTRVTVNAPDSLTWENVCFSGDGQHNGRFKVIIQKNKERKWRKKKRLEYEIFN